MPYPGVGFPIPPSQWPHVGQQWPLYNIESDQAEGLIAWWPTLASRGRNVLRDLAYNHTGTLEGSTGWANSPVIGPMLTLDGVGDYVSVPSASALNVTGNMTIAFWAVSPDWGKNAYQIMLAKVTAGLAYQYQVRPKKNAGNLRFVLHTGTVAKYATAPAALTNDKLYHLACIYDDPLMRLFQDGVNVGDTNNGSFAIDTGTGDLAFGRLGSRDADYFEGWMGGVRLYKRPFNDAQTAQLSHPATMWELYQIPRRLWRLGAIAPPPTAALPIFAPPDAVHSLVFGGVTVR